MSYIKVDQIKWADARTDGVSESYSRSYLEKDGLDLVERLSTTNMGDFHTGSQKRISHDNGRTFGEWEDVYKEGYDVLGDHDRTKANSRGTWNPVHKHYVGIAMERIFRKGHETALSKIWTDKSGTQWLSDHTYVCVRHTDDTSFRQLVMYEDGAEFDINDPTNPEYFSKNTCYTGSNMVFDKNGDIIFPIGAPVIKCCKLAGLDVNEVFPSKPDTLRGLIVVRGHWNGEKYELTYSRPVVISDLQSSRGMDEPTIALLKNGRIVVVFRGAYYMNKNWNTRIEPGTPSFKWYTWSDDGGKTFTPAMPWHFDDGEVIYSSASISHFFRDPRTDRLYWIGNITGHVVYENHPRFPLCIVEVDQTYGTAIKESYTLIDTRREGESEKLHLSNFTMMQDRETGHLHVRLTKLNQFDDRSAFEAEPWLYDITLPE